MLRKNILLFEKPLFLLPDQQFLLGVRAFLQEETQPPVGFRKERKIFALCSSKNKLPPVWRLMQIFFQELTSPRRVFVRVQSSSSSRNQVPCLDFQQFPELLIVM